MNDDAFDYFKSFKLPATIRSRVEQVLSEQTIQITKHAYQSHPTIFLWNYNGILSTTEMVCITVPNVYEFDGVKLDLTAFAIESDSRALPYSIYENLALTYNIEIHGITRKVFIHVDRSRFANDDTDAVILEALQKQMVRVETGNNREVEWVKVGHPVIEKEFNCCIPVNLPEEHRLIFTVKGAMEKHDILYFDTQLFESSRNGEWRPVTNITARTKYGTYPLLFWLTIPPQWKSLLKQDPTWVLATDIKPFQNEIEFSIPVPTSIVRFIRKWKINTNIFKVT